MKTLFIFLLLIMHVQAETLFESITEKNASKATKSIENGYVPQSEDEKRLNALAGTKKRAIDNISIKVIEKNVSKDLTIGVQYTPPFKHGNIIDNKENAEIKLEYKF